MTTERNRTSEAAPATSQARIAVEEATTLTEAMLDDLCNATQDAIADGIGFNWNAPPPKDTLDKYWRGVLMVPERRLFLATLDNVIAGAAQLVRPGRNKELSAFMGVLDAHFVAPWARGHGLARALLEAVERDARRQNLSVLRLDVRETQDAALALYESAGYLRWGVLPKYEVVNGKIIAGHFFYKTL